MQLSHTVIILVLFVIGCGPDPYAEGRKHTAEQIEQVQSGSGRSLHLPPLDLFETAAKEASFVKNLRELSLSGSFDHYANIPLASFVDLERVTLVDTEKTVSYLKALPSGIKTLALDRTDLTSGSGARQRLNDREFTESLLQTMERFNSVETIFICPWDKHLTPIAVEVLPKLQALKQLDVEWASEIDISSLRKALPNCTVRLVTEH